MSADNNLRSVKRCVSSVATSGAHLPFRDPQGNPYTSATRPSRDGPVTAAEFDYQFNNCSDAGTWTLRVQNPDGQTSGSASFTVTAPAPSNSSVSPTSMSADNNL